jgi:hypothetical protein
MEVSGYLRLIPLMKRATPATHAGVALDVISRKKA